MQDRLSWVRAVSAALVLCVNGCSDALEAGLHGGHFAGWGNDDDDGPIEDPCLNLTLYAVQGDTYTQLSSGAMTLDARGRVSSELGAFWRPDIEPRAKATLDIHRYEGRAELLWNDAVVDALDIDAAFVTSLGTKVLAYRDPDGSVVEFHVLSREECLPWQGEVISREEVEELER